jgi:AcrR family transcriptional regulator
MLRRSASDGGVKVTGNKKTLAGSRPRQIATKKNYHHGDLRAAIVEQAKHTIAKAGLDGFTLRALARELGINHTAVYHHFADKRALLVCLALESHDSLAEALARHPNIEDISIQLTEIVKKYVHWAWANPALYAVMFGPRMNEDGLYPELEQAIDTSFAAMEVIFIKQGATSSRARELAVALLTQLHGYMDLVRLQRLRVRNPKEVEKLAVILTAPFVEGVRGELVIQKTASSHCR